MATYPGQLICPCENGGHCGNISMGNLTCTCIGSWENQRCTKYGWPKTPWDIAAFVVQTTGCSTVLILLSITIGAYLVARDKTPQAILILLSDMCALMCHLLIYLFRSPFITDMTETACRAVSLLFQFFSLSHYSFLLLQSFHSYSVTTNVITGGWWPLSAWPSIGLAFGLPAVIVTISAAKYFEQLNLPWGCLINFGSNSNWFFIVPAFFISAITMIVSEAGGADSRDLKRLIKTAKMTRHEWVSAQFGLRSSALIVNLSFVATMLISQSVYHLNIYLCSIAFICNMTFATCLFFFHSIENTKIRSILKRFWDRLRCKVPKVKENWET